MSLPKEEEIQEAIKFSHSLRMITESRSSFPEMVKESLATAWWRLRSIMTSYKAFLEPLIDEEQKLRKIVIAAKFPTYKEGTNWGDLPEGWRLKATIKFKRKVDEAIIKDIIKRLKEEKEVAGAEDLIRWTPEVNLKAYRELTKEQQKIFDEAIEIVPASPELEIVPPKEG